MTPTRAKQMRAWNAQPHIKKRRAAQNAARREYEKEHGDLPSSVHVDHIKPLDEGGTNAVSNLRALSEHDNRAYPRDARNQPTGPARDYGKRRG